MSMNKQGGMFSKCILKTLIGSNKLSGSTYASKVNVSNDTLRYHNMRRGSIRDYDGLEMSGTTSRLRSKSAMRTSFRSTTENSYPLANL